MYSKKVVVTGFGPFKEHKINASWEAVKLLPELEIPGIELIIEEIPVTYIDVEKKVKQIWESHCPMLVLHVGVSSYTQDIKLEKIANRTGYFQSDCFGNLHPTGSCCEASCGEDTITCGLNIDKISERVTKNDTNEIISNVSTNAGRYLCEFIFYKSMAIDHKRTLFVHVPPLNKPYSAKELAIGLKNIIEEALKQLQTQD